MDHLLSRLIFHQNVKLPEGITSVSACGRATNRQSPPTYGYSLAHLIPNFHPFSWLYPLVNIQKAIEHGHLQWIFPLKMMIFHGKMLVHQRVVNPTTPAPGPGPPGPHRHWLWAELRCDGFRGSMLSGPPWNLTHPTGGFYENHGNYHLVI